NPPRCFFISEVPMAGDWQDCPALGPGWKRREAFRKSGASCGRSDIYYLSPTGDKIRSKVELTRYLGPACDLTLFDFRQGILCYPAPKTHHPVTVPSKQKKKPSKPSKVKKRQRVGCGECTACLVKEDCGTCSICRLQLPHDVASGLFCKCEQRRCLRIVEKVSQSDEVCQGSPQSLAFKALTPYITTPAPTESRHISDLAPTSPAELIYYCVDEDELLHDLQVIQDQIWKPLAAVAAGAGNPAVPHPFQIGATVYIRCHQSKAPEPLWKGPYTVPLTTPMALKVDRIAAWVHASLVKKAGASGDRAEDEAREWRLQRTQNPLRLRLSHNT
ncbi:Methyl-CpG-binding domain protein 1, partial [Cricetulus griseus]